MTENLGILRNWTFAAGQVNTLAGFNAFLESARTIATSANGSLSLPDRNIRDREAFQLLITGLSNSPEALIQAAAALPEDVVGRLSDDITRHSSYPPPAMGGEAFSEAARNSRTMGRYVLGRLGTVFKVARDGKYSDETIDHYRYDPSIVQGRYKAHQAADQVATSQEGAADFERTHQAELEAVRKHLEVQLGIGPETLRGEYEKIRDEVMPHAERSQALWDVMALTYRSATPPDFKVVSKAFWDRDQAIRKHEGLQKLAIGPWEYDLLDTPKTQARYYFSSWAYVLDKITKDYDMIENSITLTDQGKRLQDLRQYRLDLERAYMAMARGEGTDSDRLAVADAEGRYMGFLTQDLSRLDLTEVRRFAKAANEARQHYISESKRVNVETARAQYELFKGREDATFAIDGLEMKWQATRYSQMIDLLVDLRGISNSEIQKLRALVQLYQEKGEEYLKVASAMMNEDPGTREHNRNSTYRDLFLILWDLHDEVKTALKKSNAPQADSFELLSFSYKTQAMFIARGAQGVHGVEPLVEVTLGLKDALDTQENGGYLLPKLYDIAGRLWGLNILSRYASQVNVVGAEKLFGYFGQGLRPESYMIEGGVDVFPMEAQGIPQDQFSRRGALLDVTHIGQLEFAQAMGLAFLFGLPHTAILAQKGVSMFPIAGPFLGGIDVSGYHYLGSGAYIQRTKDPKRRQFENFILMAHLGMGNFLNIYGGGTRDIANPLPPVFADLKAHPEALHMPGYHPTRYSTGQPVKVAQEAGQPIIPVAHNLDNIYPEPSMPMPPEVQMPNGKDVGALLKGKTAPLGKKLSDLANYPSKLTGFVSERTMFPYMRPGQDKASVAYGDPIFTESLITEADLTGMGYEQQGQDAKWLLLQLNFGLVRYGEMRAGYMATAGIHGRHG